MLKRSLIFILFIGLQANASTVYRYQDDKGRWHFSDRKPEEQHETLTVGGSAVEPDLPKLQLYQRDANASPQLVALNPLYTPVQFVLYAKGEPLGSWVVDARAQEPVLVKNRPISAWQPDYTYQFLRGRPVTASDGQALVPPIPAQGKFQITQGFNGHYSHTQEPNRYAIDIAMDVGESIHAARDGIVVTVKDDYHMGGANSFFLDKANHIEVLHSDGTFAVYAHILLGSAVVKEGQRVQIGDPLASAGSSGYSTGPHLHFGLRANDGKRLVSLPFSFKLGDRIIEPKAEQWLQRH